MASMGKDALSPEATRYAKVGAIGGFHFSEEKGRMEGEKGVGQYNWKERREGDCDQDVK